MIKSANDASHLLAEHLGGGDAAAFVAAMNRRAQELGCPGMKFYNAHGLPPARNAPENEATARELALLAARLLEYPDLMRISAIKMDWIRKDTPKPTELFNHNTLISRLNCPGVDGLKTGLTNKAGNCVTATCLRNGRRLIAVATGCSTAKNRDRLVAGLFDWGYQQPPAAAPAAKATPPAARQPGHGG
jgi:D-alanyl-D-alanine carboxypeptidase (penicillin-binding protein 5/6)